MIKKFIKKLMFKKGVKVFTQIVITGLLLLTPIAKKYGISIELDETVLVASIAALIEMVRNFAKHKLKATQL